jgi:hypothetical protein
MPIKGKKRKPARKRGKKSRAKNKNLFMGLSQLLLPILLLLFVTLSLAATFYIIFLHTPAKPLL